MLTIPAHSSRVACIAGIDPGSTLLGLAYIYFDIITLDIVKTHSRTIKAAQELDPQQWDALTYGERYARIEIIKKILQADFSYHRPIKIAIETPFMNALSPAAFAPLVEVKTAIRGVAIEYDPWQDILVYPPSSVKKAIGVIGTHRGKEAKVAIKNAVDLKLPELNYLSSFEYHHLGTDAVDAIAVAYCCFKELKQNLHR